MSISDLIERVEGATGPDQELDAAIWIALEYRDYRITVGPHLHPFPSQVRPYRITLDGTGWREPPKFTASLDAALALCERVLPGHSVAVGTMAFEVPGKPWGCIWAPTGFVLKETVAATPALALILAMLKALQAKEAVE